MSRALNIAGENITGATENHVRSVRKAYLGAAREALDSIDLATLPPSKHGVYSMLKQKLQSIDPVSYPQFSALAGFDAVPVIGDSKWKLGIASALLGTTAIALLGQPTLLHKLFYGQLSPFSQLDVELWDTSDVIRNNLIAMAIALGGLLIWSKLS